MENDSNFKGYLTVRDLKKIQGQVGTEYATDPFGVHGRQGQLLESLW